MPPEPDHPESSGPFYVVSRGGTYAAGSGWGKYISHHDAIERRDSLRAAGMDAIITTEL